MPFLGLNIVLGGSFITSFPLTSIHLIWECRLVPCVCFAGKNRSLRLMPYGTISWPRVFGLSSFLKCKLFFYCIGPLCILQSFGVGQFKSLMKRQGDYSFVVSMELSELYQDQQAKASLEISYKNVDLKKKKG